MVAGSQLRQIPPPTEQRGGIAGVLGGVNHPLHIGRHALIGVHIGVNIFLGLFVADPNILGQRKGADAVNNAKVHRLGATAQLGGDHLRRQTKHLRRRGCVNIRATVKSINHRLIFRHGRQHPQFNLGIVRVHQSAPGGGDEKLAHFPPQIRANGNVLQIRLQRGDPPGAGLHLIKAGVYPPVRINHFQQAIAVSAFQLSQCAIFHDFFHHRVGRAQTLQHLGIGGIAAFCLFLTRQTQVLKQGNAQLLGRVDIKLVTHRLKDLIRQGGNAGAQLLGERLDSRLVHIKSGALHACQHTGQGQFDFRQQFALPGIVDQSVRLGKQLRQDHRQRHRRLLLIQTVAVRRHRHIVFQRQLGQIVLGVRRAQQIGRQLQIAADISAPHPLLLCQAVQFLGVVAKNAHRILCQQRAHKIAEFRCVCRHYEHRVPQGEEQIRYRALCHLRHHIHIPRLTQTGQQIVRVHTGEPLRLVGRGRSFRLPAGHQIPIQIEFINERKQFQFAKQGYRCRRVAAGNGVMGRGSINRRIGANGAQIQRKICLILVPPQFFPHAGFNIQCV